MSNVAAEFGLLAGLCRNPETYFQIQQYLSIDDFTEKAHEAFFVVLQRLLLNSTGSKILVTRHGLLAEASSLQMKDFHEVCRDGDLIDACLEYEGTEEDTIRSFLQVKNETTKTAYMELLRKNAKYLKETTDDTNTIINKLDNSLIDLSNKLQGVVDDEIIHLPTVAETILLELAENPGEMGADVGFPVWQRAVGGLRNGSMSFLCASAKAGKSQFGARAALELSQHIPVLYCDSELNEVAQTVRAFGMHSEINYEILETGYWKADLEKIVADGYDKTFALQCQMAKNIMEDDDAWLDFRRRKLHYKKMTGMTAREMLPYLRRWVLQHAGPNNGSRVPRCLIVWDYIKLARVDEVSKMGVGAHDVLGDTCMALHDFAEEFNVPILAFGQTNRQMDKDINMVAGAKKIVELVDSITLFHKKDADDLARDPVGTHEMHILASRYGKGVSTHINVKADLGIGKFEELGVAKFKLPPQAPAPAQAKQQQPLPQSKQTNDDDSAKQSS